MSQPAPDAPDLTAAVERLGAGGLVAFPTETVYGLGADAGNAAAVRRVFEIKRRPPTSPLILHVAGADMARTVVRRWTDEAAALADRYWPGPLTIILPRAEHIPEEVAGGGPLVGMRAPDHAVALGLIDRLGAPIAAPSANLSGRLPPVLPEHVRAAFDERDVMTLDAGPTPGGLESTVLRLPTGEEPARLLRRGPIPASDLGAHDLPPSARPDEPGALITPPGDASVPMTLLTRGEQEAARPPRGAGVIVGRPSETTLTDEAQAIALPDDPLPFAAGLYLALHEAAALRPAWVWVEWPTDDGPIWEAVRDRLARLAAGATA